MLYHVRGEDKTLLECETYTILETPELHSYISKYGRPTDTPSGNPATVTYDTEDLLSYAWYAWANQEVAWQTIIGNLMDASIACQSSPCADYYTTLSVPRGCAIRPVDCGVPEGRVSVATETRDVSVYPNPTSGMTTVELNGLTDETIKIRIIDLTGKLVKEQSWSVTTGSNFTQVDMTSAPAGVYHVEFDSEYKFKSQKIIIIK